MRSLLLLALACVLSACSPRQGPLPAEAAEPEEFDCSERLWPESVGDYDGTGPFVGDLVPNWTLPDQFGCPASFDQFLGNVTLIDISASWCGPCNEIAATSMEVLDAVRATSPRTWSITVLTHGHFNDLATVADAQWWVEEYDLEYPVFADIEGTIPSAFGFSDTYPILLFVGPDGRIYDRSTGRLEDAEIVQRINDGLEEYGL